MHMKCRYIRPRLKVFNSEHQTNTSIINQINIRNRLQEFIILVIFVGHMAGRTNIMGKLIIEEEVERRRNPTH